MPPRTNQTFNAGRRASQPARRSTGRFGRPSAAPTGRRPGAPRRRTQQQASSSLPSVLLTALGSAAGKTPATKGRRGPGKGKLALLAAGVGLAVKNRDKLPFGKGGSSSSSSSSSSSFPSSSGTSTSSDSQVVAPASETTPVREETTLDDDTTARPST